MVPKLTRTLTDTEGVAHTWVYDTTQGVNETVVTDPSGNDTVYLFYTFSQPGLSTYRTANETQRQIYQGSHTNGTLLKTILTCYNGNTTNCASPSTLGGSITQKDVYTTFPGMSQSSRSETKYDTSGTLLENKEYDYSGTLITDRVLTYGSCGTTFGRRVCSDITTDASGHIQSQTTNNYSTQGNLTATSRWVNSSTSLSNSTTYNANGTPNVVTNVNGAQTTYGSYVCNGNFPTTVSEPLSLSKLMTWDCNGGVVTSVTDENSKNTTYAYVNSTHWPCRSFLPSSLITDPLLNVTNYTYNPTTVESAMNFNGTISTTDQLATGDGFGHQLLTQTKQSQGSSSYDTVQYVYDSDFRLSTASIPCSALAGAGCTTSVTTTTYDGASRPHLQVNDGGGGYTSNNYAPGGTYQNESSCVASCCPGV